MYVGPSMAHLEDNDAILPADASELGSEVVFSTLDMKNTFSHMAVPKVSFNSKSQVRGVIIPWNWNTLVFTRSELFLRGTAQIK